VPNSANKVAIGDPELEQLISDVTSVASGAANPHDWSGNVVVTGWPKNQPHFKFNVPNVVPAVVCTGMPKPSVTGTDVEKHTTQSIKLKWSGPMF
jgi:hypothetical protein